MARPGRGFTYPWGSGVIVEEAQAATPHHVPTIQLLRYTEGEAAGRLALRFCHYSHSGRFQRSPLLMSEEAVEAMRAALRETPQLRALLVRLVGEK